MSHTPDTATPDTRRDVLAILGWLALAVFVYRVGHIPGVVNSATLIAAASSLWAVLKLVSVLRRVHIRVVALIRPHPPDAGGAAADPATPSARFALARRWRTNVTVTTSKRIRQILDDGMKDRVSLGQMADAVLATLYLQVSTQAELDALPVESVIVDRTGAAYGKSRSGQWARPGYSSCPMPLLIDGHAFTVVHRPTSRRTDEGETAGRRR